MSAHDNDVKCPAWFISNETAVHVSHTGQPSTQHDHGHDDECCFSRGQKLWFSDTAHQDEEAFVGAFREVTNQLDLLEVCAPWDTPLSQSVIDQGGEAMRVGLHNGFDLSTKAGSVRHVNYYGNDDPGTCMYLHLAMLGQSSIMRISGTPNKFNGWKNVGIIVGRF